MRIVAAMPLLASLLLPSPSAMPKLSPNSADPDMHAIYCYRWRQKNIDDYRRKNRERMARHRASDNTATPEECQARLEKRCFAAAQYREKSADRAALKPARDLFGFSDQPPALAVRTTSTLME
ncbi:hypothetical protein B0H14DRAFT_2594354 [Mycena olivaceomarginata]|nr:hypothetical protein B0H14DRAFT_2614349 [Mycena olivaceomarginata]KAJ7828908.1 hypothetical protein B0H14DRAFT_2594354 [Mycena olivaceomarginata]